MFGSFIYGIGGPTLGAGAADQAFCLAIDGADRTDLLVVQSWNVMGQLGSRGTCSFDLIDSPIGYSPDIGDSVMVCHHGAVVFGGTVEEVTREVFGHSDASRHRKLSVQCVDYNQLADRHFVNKVYLNKNVLEIATDIVNVETRLDEDGVTLGEVDEGITFEEVRFPLVTAAEAFRDLAESSGLVWMIDQNRRLNIFPRTTYTAPVAISDSFKGYMALRVSDSRDNYRNKQYLKAGVALTDIREEKFTGDSTRRTFTLSYAIGELEFPFTDANTTNNSVKRDGSAQKLGIKGVDEDGQNGTAQWFFQFGEKEISQNTYEAGHAVLTSAQTLTVRYRGEFPILIEAIAQTELLSRQAAEGGTGLYEHREDDEELDEDLAIAKADQLLALYGRIPRTVPLTIQEPGFAPGQLISIQLTHDGLNGEYLIESVRLTLVRLTPTVVFQADLTTLEGDKQESWVEFFKELARRGRRTVIRENEKLLISRQFVSALQCGPDVFTDSVNGTADLNASQDDPYSFALLGQVTLNGVTVPSCVIGRSKVGIAPDIGP